MADKTTTPTENIRDFNIYQKIAAVAGKVGAVEKGGRNTEQNYSFIEYGEVASRLRTLFAEYGVVIVPNMGLQERTTITSKYGKEGVHAVVHFKFKVINADKPDDFFEVDWQGEAADFGDKAINKATTSAIKYYQMRQFNISEKGEVEADGESHEIVNHKAAAPVEPKADADKIGKIQMLATQLGYSVEVIGAKIKTIDSNKDADTMIAKLEDLVAGQEEPA